MLFKWFSAREAMKAGTALADQFPRPAVSIAAELGERGRSQSVPGGLLRDFLRRAVHQAHTLQLNFYKRAQFANAFKWRLLEKGVDADTANEWTQTLVLEISSKSVKKPAPRLGVTAAQQVPAPQEAPAPPANRPVVGKARSLSRLADDAFARAAYAEAVNYLQDLVALKPRDATALNNLGAALSKVGRYPEAKVQFRKAIAREPGHRDAHGNLGAIYLACGQFFEAENSLRRAIEARPADVERRCDLGRTLVNLGRLREARAQFERVLKVASLHSEALVGMGLIARMEGRFDEAGALFERALEANPNSPAACAALAGIGRMTASQVSWLERAEKIATSGISPVEEATVRFAIGKYYDDVRNFERAFNNFKHANELLKTLADKYQPDVATRFADDLIRVYTRESLASAAGSTSDSMKPVFVVGMMRSGTSLVEQIIASHPAAAGAGELPFWNDAVRKYDALMRQEPLPGSLRRQLEEGYLQALARHSVDASRVVDKAPINSNYLGVIHSVFPNARIIYMRRDPIDTCLSCYFQPFSAALNFTMDLSDLAHYYREHQRLMAHWRAVLPAETILDVPYAELVADQEGWTRKILDFIGLEWDQGCLDFHTTTRPVVTASYWQVRQRIYNDSVQRWRHYRKFIGPLLDLKE
jgi:tetratricopeptide (TPR) repeat protein